MRRVRKLRYLAGVTIAALAAILVLFASGDSVTEATGFTPAHSVSVADTTPHAVSDVTISSSFPPGGSMVSGGDNFTFLPEDWNVTSGAGIPDGAIVASANALASLGVFNSFCGAFPVPIAGLPLIDATTDTSSTVIFEDTGDPGAVGEVFETPTTDALPVPNTPISIRKGVTLYPDWIANMYPAPIPDPHLRYWSYVPLPGTNVSVNIVIWAPGDLVSLGIPQDKGFPMALFLNRAGDPLDPGNPTSPITDLCAPFTTSITYLGTTGVNPFAPAAPVTQLQNPTSGEQDFRDYFRSQRDADNDTYENAVDTCPVSFNSDTSPRSFGTPINFVPLLGTSDPDGYIDISAPFGSPNPGDIGAPEGIDSACDAGPTSACTSSPFDDFLAQDCDTDGYKNRSDNCPQLANGLVLGMIVLGVTQADTDGTIGSFMPDLGPLTDDIGDACDPNPSDPDGHYHTSSAGPICVGPPVSASYTVDTCGPVDSTGNSPAVVPSIPASLLALMPTPTGAPAGGPVILPDDIFSTVTVTIGKHGVKLNSVGGPKKVNAGITRDYTVDVSNKSETFSQDIKVRLSAVANCPGGSIVINGPADQTAVGVAPEASAVLTYNITFGTCSDASGSPDYVLTADACHPGDPAGKGFALDPCPGSADGHLTQDADQTDDAPVSKSINEK